MRSSGRPFRLEFVANASSHRLPRPGKRHGATTKLRTFVLTDSHDVVAGEDGKKL